jgi:D-alanyl-D-alanine-carboxypeptidase/D-alanyl-D-alanine-endopeptidase
MNLRRIGLLWLGLLMPLGAVAAAPSPADATIRELARKWLVFNDGVGLSIGIYAHGQRQFYNFGTTRLDGDKVPTENTVYEIGAIAKTMTGQLLARAIVEGRAALTDEAQKYLDEPYPNLENGGDVVRLVHLANMTSQLADNIPDLTQVRMVPGESIIRTRMRVLEKYTRAEFLRQLHLIKPRRPPGADPAHSNVASMLLGVVLEKIYGEPYETVLAHEIEKPLKLGNGAAPLAKLLAQGYTKDNEEVPPFSAPMQFASGSLRYSTQDLLRYASWQVVERDASVKLAHQPTWQSQDRTQGVAFYWIIGNSPQGRRLRYSGATSGFASMCDLYPDAGIAVVLLSNKAADGAQESLRALSANIVGLLAPGGALSPQPSSADAPPQDR